MSTSPVKATKERAARPVGGARQRVLDAALELFGEQGVSGTSLQMIADRIGVTKAAVYHQFPSKEEIVMGVLAPALETLRESVEHAERQETAEARREAILTALVELSVGHRWLAAILQGDPAVNAMVRGHTDHDLGPRIMALLVGPSPDVRAAMAGSMVGGAMLIVCTAPELQQYGEEELSQNLLELARDLLSRHVGRA
jgi:AcrR family transcriptional regulator